MRTLSLAALTVLELSPPQMVRCAAAAGFDHVGLRLVPSTPNEPHWPSVGDTPMVRETAAALRDTGVRVWDIEILRLKPDTDVAAYRPVLETGAALGTRHVLVAGNDADDHRCAANLAALAALAAPLGLTLALEPMPWAEVHDFAQALRIVEATQCANVGVLVDAIHFDRAGDTPALLRGAPAQRLPYLQFCDAPAERPTTLEELLRQARAQRELPGEGGLALEALLRAAPPALPLSLEIPLPADVPAETRAKRVRDASLAWLRRVGLE